MIQIMAMHARRLRNRRSVCHAHTNAGENMRVQRQRRNDL